MSLRPSRVETIRGLLDEGLKVRAIQRMTRVSRKVIRQIAAGSYRANPAAEAVELPRVPAYRCKCGHLVEYRPCLICAALAAQNGRSGPDPEEPLALDLSPEMRLRYGEARDHRRALEAAGCLLHSL